MEVLHAPETGKFPQMKSFRATRCGIHAKVATQASEVTCAHCVKSLEG